MIRYRLALTILLLLLPIFTMFYKSYYLEINLVPQKASNIWEVELRADDDFGKDSVLPLVFPIPATNEYQRVENLKLNLAGQSQEIASINLGPEAADFQIINQPSKSNSATMTFTVEPQIFQFPVLRKEVKKDSPSWEILNKYLSMDSFSEEEVVRLRQLSETLVFNTDDKNTRFDKFFFFVADEISLKHEYNKISDVIELGGGSYLAQSRVLVGLARLSGIPARTIFGIKFLEPAPENPDRYTRVFMTEAFLDGEWKPYVPEGRIQGELDGQQIVLCRTCEVVAPSLGDKNVLELIVTPLKYDPITSEEQLTQLAKTSPFWSTISLHRLPLSVQAIILGIILVPFGTIAISFARVMIGVDTFGIFMPILLTLFFLETSLGFGSLFFGIVVMFGMMQRYLLDKFYLLAVPRLSILLSFTVIIYLLFSVVCVRYEILAENQRSLGYFPIVIITVFIEKLSLSLIEEGRVNTLKRVLGTFFVAVICYYLLAFDWLKSFLFNNPEMILFSIGANMLIGSYTGFRLLELLRFKEMGKAEVVNFK